MRIMIAYGEDEKLLDKIIPRLGFRYKLKDAMKKSLFRSGAKEEVK